MKESNNYFKIVEWSEEDKCYVGSCPGLFYGGCHGENEVEVYLELCKIVEENISLYKEDSKPLPAPTAGVEYSDELILPTGKELHKLLSIKAMQAGESLDIFCIKLLNQSINQLQHSPNKVI